MAFINIIWGMLVVNAAGTDLVEDGDLSSWDKFEWELTLQRDRQDEVLLEGLLEHKQGMEMIKIQAADCNHTQVKVTADREKIAFRTNCRCYLKSSSFIPEFKRCFSNRKLKHGCRYRTGSWKWLTQWSWETLDDPIMVLNSKEAHGIIMPINATTRRYNSCSVNSISYWEDNIDWVEMNFLNNASMPVFFKLKNIWHMSWLTERLSHKVKKSIEGKILKFAIGCEEETEIEDELLEKMFNSCLVFKVVGNLKFSSIFTSTEQVKSTAKTTAIVSANTTERALAKTTAGKNSITTRVLTATLATLALIIVVVIGSCYLQRRGCFASSRTRETFVEIAVEEPKSVNGDESIV